MHRLMKQDLETTKKSYEFYRERLERLEGLEKQFEELNLLQVECCVEKDQDYERMALKCSCCGSSNGMHIRNISVYQKEKEYGASPSVEADLLVEMITGRRGSAIVTEYWCEHCQGQIVYEVQYFHKGAIFVESFVKNLKGEKTTCLYEKEDLSDRYVEMWRD